MTKSQKEKRIQDKMTIHKKETTKRKKHKKIEMRKMGKMVKILNKKENIKNKKIIKS